MSSDELSLIEETEDAQQPKPPSPPAERGLNGLKKLSLLNGNMGLLLMFAAGIGSIYLLSLRKGPAEASADLRSAEVQVDDAITRFSRTDAKNVSASSVVSTFYLQAKQRHIPIDQIGHNPFVFRLPNQPLAAVTEVEKEAAVTEVDKAEEEAMEEVRLLQLQSILSGTSGSTAMISNNLLTEGQKIQGWTVKKIQQDRVVLEFKQHQHILRMPK